MSVGVNNTSTTKTKGKKRFAPSLLTPVLIGNYSMSLGTSNGQYSLLATAVATVVGHSFSGIANATVLGSATAYVYNITKKRVEKAVVPIKYLIAIGNNVFFTVGNAAPATASRWNTLGLTMPEDGDSMAMTVMLHLDGARPVGGWKQTWTANF